MADLIQLRRDTAANWTSANPTLSQGEQGYETDTGKMKIGDGSTAWTSLAYFVDSSAYATSSDITTAVSTKANTADLATVATTGAYSDLTGTPTVPAALTDLSITDGTAGQVLSADGDGTYTFIDAASGGGGGGSFEAVASGSLSDGSIVVVNSDGTVSVVAEGGVVSSSTSSLGTTTVSNASKLRHAAAYDNINNLILFATIDGSSIKCTAGSISDGVIAFGSTSTIPSFAGRDRGGLFVFFDSASQKFVVVNIRTNSSPYSPYGVAITVDSATKNLTFGSNVQLMSGGGGQLSIAQNPTTGDIVGFTSNLNNSSYSVAFLFSVVGGNLVKHEETVPVSANPGNHWISYDPILDKFVISTDSNSIHRLISVSSNSMTFSTLTVSGLPASLKHGSAEYNTKNGNHVMAYQDQNNSYNMYAVCAIVTSSTISYGTPLLLSTDTVRNSNTASANVIYDPISEKMVVFASDSTNTKAYRLDINNAGTISASTDFTFSGSDSLSYTRPAYDSTTQKIIVATSVSTTITLNSFTAGGNVTINLTAENYIGISDAAYSDGATATVQIVGSVDDAQSGLTPGQSYYVQTDGTLATTADDPSVFAGTAVAATKLIVKG